MAENKQLSYLIDLAISKEEQSYNFYMSLHERVNDSKIRETLKFLAEEEVKHKEFLIAYRKGNYPGSLNMDAVVDYRIAEHIEKPELKKDMNTQDIYLVAAHNELNSYNFYKGLSDMQPSGEVKDMLLKMANEELKHKEKVEYLYSNTAFPQTAGG